MFEMKKHEKAKYYTPTWCSYFLLLILSCFLTTQIVNYMSMSSTNSKIVPVNGISNYAQIEKFKQAFEHFYHESQMKIIAYILHSGEENDIIEDDVIEIFKIHKPNIEEIIQKNTYALSAHCASIQDPIDRLWEIFVKIFTLDLKPNNNLMSVIKECEQFKPNFCNFINVSTNSDTIGSMVVFISMFGGIFLILYAFFMFIVNGCTL